VHGDSVLGVSGLRLANSIRAAGYEHKQGTACRQAASTVSPGEKTGQQSVHSGNATWLDVMTRMSNRWAFIRRA
jgi:hypothetical protein